MARVAVGCFLENLVRYPDETMSCEFDGEQVLIQFHRHTYVATRQTALELMHILLDAALLIEDKELATKLLTNADKLDLSIARDPRQTRH